MDSLGPLFPVGNVLAPATKAYPSQLAWAQTPNPTGAPGMGGGTSSPNGPGPQGAGGGSGASSSNSGLMSMLPQLLESGSGGAGSNATPNLTGNQVQMPSLPSFTYNAPAIPAINMPALPALPAAPTINITAPTAPAATPYGSSSTYNQALVGSSPNAGAGYSQADWNYWRSMYGDTNPAPATPTPSSGYSGGGQTPVIGPGPYRPANTGGFLGQIQGFQEGTPSAGDFSQGKGGTYIPIASHVSNLDTSGNYGNTQLGGAPGTSTYLNPYGSG